MKKLIPILTLALIAFLASAGSVYALYYYGGSYDGYDTSGIHRVQGQVNGVQGTANLPSASVAFPSNVNAGNLIIVSCGRYTEGTAFTAANFTDTLGNTYYLAATLKPGSGYSQVAIAYANNITGGACTVTCDLPGAETGWISMAIEEVSGQDTSGNVLITTSSNSAYTNSITTGNLVVATNALLHGWSSQSNVQAISKNGSYSQVANSNDSNNLIYNAVDRVVSANTYNIPWTMGGSESWTAIGAAFKEAVPEFPPGLTIPSGSTINVNTGTLNVTGYITIGGTLQATTGAISLTGDWTRTGTFTCGTGTVTFNGSAAQIVTGTMISANSFYAVVVTNASAGGTSFTDAIACETFKDITASSKLYFGVTTGTEDPALQINGAAANSLNINGGSTSTRIVLDRYGGSGTDKWEIWPQNTGWTVNCVDVSNSVNTNANSINPTNSISTGGNTTNWFTYTRMQLTTFFALGMFGSVKVEWETASELNNAGFNIYRSLSQDGPWVKLNTALIPGLGTSARGKIYNYIDRAVTNGITFYYLLEEVEFSGKAIRHGPVEAHPGLDSDNDGMTDDWEIHYSLNPHDPNNALLDNDGDGVNNLEEFISGTDPLLTPDQDPAVDPDEEGDSITYGSLIYKLLVNKDGVYKVTGQSLKDSGLDISKIKPKDICVYNQGQEIPVYVSGEEDGVFDAEDFIEFYGDKFKSRFTDANVYLFGSISGEGMRMQEALSQAGAEEAMSFLNKFHYEEDEYYWGELPDAGYADDHFFFSYMLMAIDSTDAVDYTLGLNNINRAETQDAQVEVALRSIDDTAHHCKIYLNGGFLGDARWDGLGEFVYQATTAQTNLADGTNTITIELLSDNEEGYDFVLINWIDVDYWKKFAASDNYLEFSMAGPGYYNYRVSNFTTDKIEVFKVLKDGHASRITGFEILPNAGTYEAQFGDENTEGAKYVVVGQGALISPAGIVEDSPSNLRDTRNQADYIIITYDGFYNESLRLADYRKSQGMAVKVVKAEDIYDDFNHGIFDPGAIREFLKYTYNNWKKPSPVYVLLVGDATYDYKDNEALGTVNYMPTYMVHNSLFGETASDNWFVCLDGKGDFLPDMFIGRLPARSVSEAKIMVDKIISYENLPDGQDWTKKTMLVADNDIASFELISNSLASIIPLEYSSQKIFLKNYASSASCKADIINGINNGRLIINYAGHGSIRIWASEKIFQVSDIKLLNNASMLPFVVTPTCLNGYFLYSGAYNYEALAEEMVRKSAGGAIAAFSPSGLSDPGDQQILVESLFKAVFENGDFRIGPAITSAKSDLFYSGSAGAEDVSQTYILFGDPALKLKMPAEGNWDKAMPQVAGTSPSSADKGVSLSTEIRIEFSEPMNQVFTRSGFSISPDISGTITWKDNTLVFKPDAALDYDTTYTVTLLATAQDLAGNSLDGNANGLSEGFPLDNYNFSFTTAKNTYSVSGRVSISGGAGLNAVDINLSGDASQTVSTDTSGSYIFTGLANGSYIFTPHKEGYSFTPQYKNITVSDNNISGIDFTALPEPMLAINPTALDFGEAESSKTLQISNTGAGTLNWTARPDKSWISVNPGYEDTTTEIDTIFVNINRSGLGIGLYTGTIKISSNGGTKDIAVTMAVTREMPDTSPPYLSDQNPESGETQVPCDTNISLHIKDDKKGVNRNAISLSVDGAKIIKDGVVQKDKDAGIEQTVNSPNDYIVSYSPKKDFKYEQVVTVTVSASDLASPANKLSAVYSFTIEMMTMGTNIRINDSRPDVNCGFSSIAASPNGKNIYAVWEEEDIESKRFSIYFDKFTDKTKSFGSDIKILTDPAAGDQRFPVVALQNNGNIYVAWQQKNLDGEWNIYLAKSSNEGKSFTLPKRIGGDLNGGDQSAPCIGARSNNEVYVAWVDNRHGKDTVYFAASEDGAKSFSLSMRVDDGLSVSLSHPSLKQDSSGDIYISWSARNKDNNYIYFDRGKRPKGKNKVWDFGTDIQVSSKPFNGTFPSLGVSAGGKYVCIAWQGVKGDSEDILFSKSIDYGENFKKPISIIDDNGSSLQSHPSLALDNNVDIYIAWEDYRWTESDIYLAYSMNKGDKLNTNILVNDDTANVSQVNPCLALDKRGNRVFISWTDYRDGNPNIYFTCNTGENNGYAD